jgi:hypothetical protein
VTALALPLLLAWALWILFTAIGVAAIWAVATAIGAHGFFDAATRADADTGRTLQLLVMAWTGVSFIAAMVVAMRMHARLRRAQAAESDAAKP